MVEYYSVRLISDQPFPFGRLLYRDLKQIYEYRELLYTFVSKGVRSRYKGSVLGFAWNFAIPLLQLLVFWILFGIIVKVAPPGDYPFAIFLFTGLLPWNYFAGSLLGGSGAVMGNANLVKKIYFPLQILPLTTVMSELVTLLLSLIVLALIVVVFGIGLSWYLILLPIPIIIETIICFGLASLFACGNVFYRDVGHIMGIVVMAWMYLTPVLYPLNLIADKAPWASIMIHLNPLTGIITAYQQIILDHKSPDWFWLGYSLLFSLITFLVGFAIFNHYKFQFEEEV